MNGAAQLGQRTVVALDVYVMPLWRFKVGDFRSPVESATGLRPKVVSPEGIVDTEPPARVGWFGRWRAKREVAVIRRAVESVNRSLRPVRWTDDGDVVYSGQAPGFETLRAYARWLDCRDQLPEFEAPLEGNYYEHPVLKIQVDRLSCPHLVEHNCHSGYFLPCDFEQMAKVEPYLLFGNWPMHRPVGSSPQLLRDLDIVRSTLPSLEVDMPAVDGPIAHVKAAYTQLREVAELSCRKGLPIIFWG